MSREIKFRAWDGEKMLYEGDERGMFGLRITNDGVWYYEESADVFFWHELEYADFEFMQYTGLKDKNGTEIYEGDILKLHEYADVSVPVVFHKGCFCVKGFNWDNKRVEVVGNIYENADLTTTKSSAL